MEYNIHLSSCCQWSVPQWPLLNHCLEPVFGNDLRHYPSKWSFSLLPLSQGPLFSLSRRVLFLISKRPLFPSSLGRERGCFEKRKSVRKFSVVSRAFLNMAYRDIFQRAHCLLCVLRGKDKSEIEEQKANRDQKSLTLKELKVPPMMWISLV